MNHYFHLQKTIIERHLRAWRLHPWFAYGLGALLFFSLGWLLYSRTDYAGWAVVVAGVSALRWLSGRERNDFLAITFHQPVYRKIRLVENAIFTLPFVVLLLLWGDWALALVQCLLGGAMSFLRINSSSSYTLPTPFGRYPFEAATGFRRYWWLVAGAVFAFVMGVRAENMELSIFAYGVLMIVFLMFYQDPEPSFYVWIHADDPKSFLIRKLKIALGYQLLFGLPFLLAIWYFFPGVGWLLLLGPVLAALNLALTVLMKYSNFPHHLNITHSFALLAGLILWPLLLFLLPYYYQRALPLLEANLPASTLNQT